MVRLLGVPLECFFLRGTKLHPLQYLKMDHNFENWPLYIYICMCIYICIYTRMYINIELWFMNSRVSGFQGVVKILFLKGN